MKVITDRLIRNRIKADLKGFAAKMKGRPTEYIDNTLLQVLEKNLLDRKAISNSVARETLSKELSVAFFGVFALYVQTMLFDPPNLPKPNDGHSGAFLGQPDDGILFGLLSEFTNSALAVIRLTEDGLERSAGPILRSMHEASWLILVLLDSPEKMRLYVNTTEKEEKRVWHSHFNFSALNRSLGEIEKKYYLSADLIEGLQETRKTAYSDYSKAVHPTKISAVCGGLDIPARSRGDGMTINLLGCPSKAMRGSLQTLIWCLQYFTLVYLHLVKSRKKPLPGTPECLLAMGMAWTFTDVCKHIQNRKKHKS